MKRYNYFIYVALICATWTLLSMETERTKRVRGAWIVTTIDEVPEVPKVPKIVKKVIPEKGIVKWVHTHERIAALLNSQNSAQLTEQHLTQEQLNVALVAAIIETAKNPSSIAKVEECLDLGGNPEHKDSQYGFTPLMHAANLGLLPVVRKLLRKDVNLDESNLEGWTALMFACSTAHCEIADILLKKKADATKKNSLGQTALMLACIKGSHAIVTSLLLVSNIDEQDNTGNTAFMHSSTHGHLAIVKLLVDNNANTALPNIDSVRAMQMTKDKQILPSLTNSKSALPIPQHMPMCALPAWYLQPSAPVMQLPPILKPILPSSPVNEENACLIIRRLMALIATKAREGDFTLFNKLTDEKNIALKELLIHAIETDNVYLVQTVINQQAPINTSDGRGNTPLLHAIFRGSLAVAQFLIEHANGIDLDAQNIMGETALIMATIKAHENRNWIRVIKALHASKANLVLTDITGKPFYLYVSKELMPDMLWIMPSVQEAIKIKFRA